MADQTKSAALVTVRDRAKKTWDRNGQNCQITNIFKNFKFKKIQDKKCYLRKSVTVSEKDQNIGSQGFNESNNQNFLKILNFIKKIQMADLTKMLSQNMYT